MTVGKYRHRERCEKTGRFIKEMSNLDRINQQIAENRKAKSISEWAEFKRLEKLAANKPWHIDNRGCIKYVNGLESSSEAYDGTPIFYRAAWDHNVNVIKELNK